MEPAKLSVKGYGLFGNRELKALLVSLLRDGRKPETYDATFVEDSVLVLFSKLARDGYLNPVIKVATVNTRQERQTFTWTGPLGEPLPRPLDAREVQFQIEEGVLFYYEFIGFTGVKALRLDEAAHFFVETDAIIKLKKNRIYSPQRLAVSLKNLGDAYQRLGYQSAVVTATNLVVVTNTGAVTLDIVVAEGPRSWVKNIRIEGATNTVVEPQTITTNLVFSPIWEQDFVHQLKRNYYMDGFADVQVTMIQERREAAGNEIYIDLAAQINPGPRQHIGQVYILGENNTREGMMRRRVGVEPGDLLNPVEVERGRYNLARLGIFDTVELRYEQIDEETRDIYYQVKEGKRVNFSLLAGYGSYESLRGGVELEQYNLWGLAHHSRLRLVQSFKASSGEYTYTIPQVLGKDFDIFFNASGLRREEISFVREEFGGGAGVSRHFRSISSDVSARYNYQVLNATRFEVPPAYGLQSATVGSFIFDLRHDMRDNPLTPRAGYKIFSNFEIASDELLGEANYERFEVSASYHKRVGRARWLHFGISHGVLATPGSPATDLPFNKRFFPGGDNSIRGYQLGEAAPRDEFNRIVGGESYTLGNIEFEQGLTRTLSVVFFGDALGNAVSLDNYPFNEGLYTIGGGLRWKTLIGPARLEYGYNLHRREVDPMGTLHFSIGFPF